jgi:hypothetical protein
MHILVNSRNYHNSKNAISISAAILLVGALAARLVIGQSYALRNAARSPSVSYIAGYKMGCTDGPDQENFIGSGGVAHHTRAFVLGV